jgi:hypothetical protein
MDQTLAFIVGLCLIGFVGSLAYNLWQGTFYKRPRLSRTQVSLEIDEDVIYLHHITAITEEYVYSLFLTLICFLLGFLLYLLFFFFNGLMYGSPAENIILSVVLTAVGGLLGYFASLDKKTVIWDASGRSHEVRLPEVERLEFTQEITKDIWRMCK